MSGQASLISMVFNCIAAALVHRNDFCCLYQQNKSFESKLKFRQASNDWKRILEAVRLAYANKTKASLHK